MKTWASPYPWPTRCACGWWVARTSLSTDPRARLRSPAMPSVTASTTKAAAQWLVPLEALAQRRGGDDPRVVGGKAARLGWLVRNGFSVPSAVVLPAEAFTQAIRELPPGCEPRALLRAASGRAG